MSWLTDFESLLLNGPVLVLLDAAHPDVEVPFRLKSDRNLCLRIGYGLTPEIPDLMADHKGVSCTLTFNNIPTWCFIPWEAVRRLTSERTLVQPKKRERHLKLVN